MRVLLLTLDFPPAKGGIQIWMFELARRLPDAEVTVIAPRMQGDRAFDASTRIRVRRLGGARLGRTGWFIHLVVATIWRCLTRRPDLIVCGHVLTVPIAFLVYWSLGIPYAVFAYAYEIRRRRRRWLVGPALRQAPKVLAISRFTKAAVLGYHVASERVAILYPGVDRTLYGPRGHDQDDGTPERPTIILSVSRIDDLYKGNDTVIRALPIVKSKHPNVRYLIAGGGRLGGYLAKLAVSVGVERDVVFLGEVPDEALPNLYSSCGVFIQASREAGSGGGAEGFGIVCLEAAACGKPVVAGRSGGLPDALEDGVTGILVDPEDIRAVAEAILSLLQDPALAERMGQAGRARVLREFTWDHMAQRARCIFAEVAGQVWEPRRASSS